MSPVIARSADHPALDRQRAMHDDPLFAMNHAHGVDPRLRIGHPEAGMREHHGLRRDGAKSAVGVDEIELPRIERILTESDGKRVKDGVPRR